MTTPGADITMMKFDSFHKTESPNIALERDISLRGCCDCVLGVRLFRFAAAGIDPRSLGRILTHKFEANAAIGAGH